MQTEACDDGYTDACGSCNSNCTGPGSGSTCGDSVRCPQTEACDDGYTDACGSCNSNCSGPGGGSCGDGTRCPETEVCDGANINGATCGGLGFDAGAMACYPAVCTLDPRGCLQVGDICGDGTRNGLEGCDGSMPWSCADFNAGFGAGVPVCNGDCTIDFGTCAVTDFCAVHGLYNNTYCDACHLLGGTLDPDCTNLCGGGSLCADYWDLWGGGFTCALAGLPPDPDCTCGDGVASPSDNERCDGADLDGYTCQDYGFSGGTLACSPDCTPDFSGCTRHPGSVCGDGVITGLEQCDSDPPQPCSNFSGFGTGTVVCSARCTWNFSNCTSADWCANHSYYNDGVCDPCASLSGTPDPDCAAFCGGGGACADYFSWFVDDFTCPAAGFPPDPDCTCGNGVRDLVNIEYCDGTDFGGATCIGFGFAGGSLSCRTDCTIDFDGCLL
jgi:hypothetical protein